jgi:hypothetical protein
MLVITFARISSLPQSKAQGPLIARAEAAGVRPGVNFEDLFGVVSLPFINEKSYWLNRKRERVE